MAISCDALQVYEGLGGAHRRRRGGRAAARLEHRLLGFVPVTETVLRRRLHAAGPRRDRRGAGGGADADRGRRDRPLPAGGRSPSSRWSQAGRRRRRVGALVAEDAPPDDDLRARHGASAALRADRRADRGDRRRRGARRRRGGRGRRRRRAPRARRSASTSSSAATSSAMKKRSRNYARRQLTWMRKIPDLRRDRSRPIAAMRPGRGARSPHAHDRLRPVKFEKWQALGNDYLIVEAETLPWELTAAAGRADLRPAFRRRLRRRPAAVAQRGPGVRRRPADLQPRRLRGRALRQRRPRGDPLPAPPRLDRRRRPSRSRPSPARSRRRSPASGPARSTWAGPRPPPRTFPPAATDGRGTARRRRPRVGVPARLDRQPAVRDRGRRGARGPRPGGDRARDRRPRALPEPHQRLLPRASRATGCGRGSSSAAWGRRSPPAPAPAAPRSPPSSRGAPSPITVELDGGELEVEIGEDLDVRLTGWAEPVYARRALAGAARRRSPSWTS